MTRSTTWLLALAALTLTACPSDRVAQKTIRPWGIVRPPEMMRPAAPVITTITDLRAPESVLYDAQQDVYFISNVNGSMQAADANGLISRVDARTFRISLKWIESGRGGVRLDAPKGMAIVGDVLYVSDLPGVRKFDRRSGAALGLIPIPGATFLNDIATDGKSLYVSETAVRLGPGNTFYESGNDAIWKITGDRVDKLAGGKGLENPNGLDFIDGRLHVVTFGGNNVYEIDAGERSHERTLPRGQLDGITHLSDNTILVSSWKGEGIYESTDDGFRPILAGMDAPADLTYDAKHQRLLIPHPGTNQVTVHAFNR